MASSKVKAAKPDKKSVKDGRVTKSSQTSKTKGAEIAKKVAKKVSRRDVSSSASESDSASDATSSSSESSASESEAEIKPTKTKGPVKANGARKDDSSSASDDSSDSSSKGGVPVTKAKPTHTKANGAPKANAKADSDSSSASDSESSSDESSNEKTPAVANAKAKAKAEDSSSASDSESESESESDSDDDTAKKAAATKPINGTSAAVKASSSSPQSSDESSASESDEEEVSPAKKRKAEVEETPVPKKAKVEEPAKDTRITNLFVGSLSWNIDEEWLMREFEQFGEIASCRIITERDSGRSKGFGYITFVTHEAAAQALEEKQGAIIDNRAVNLDWSTPRDDSAPKAKFQDRSRKFGDKESPPSATLFLGNLSFEITPDDVRENFEQYGQIARISIPTDRDTGAVKGFGYVDFGSVAEATEAKNNLTGQYIKGRPLRLDFGKPRDDNGGFGGGRGGGFGGRGGRGGGRGGARGGRGGGRGDRGGFQKNFSTNRGGMGEFKGTKVSFD